MNESKPSPRKRRGWWLLLPVLGLLIAGGVVAYRVHVGPRLQPAARYQWTDKYECPLRFSAQGMGYPAIGIVDQKKPGGITISQPHILDDLCRPLAATENDADVSPTRELIAWITWGSSGAQFNIRHRNGYLAQAPCPTGIRVEMPGPVPCSDMVIGYKRSSLDRIWLYNSNGRRLPTPTITRGQIMPYWIASADDRLITLTDRKSLYLYDHMAKNVVLATPFPWDQTSMVWRYGDRLLLAPRMGNALVFDGTKRIASIAPGTDGWRWCEDGTVWTLTGGKLQVLRWRTGTPAPAYIKTRGTPGTRYGSLAPGAQSNPPFRENTDPDWAAVWGDGTLVATVENNTLAAERVAYIFERAAAIVRIKISIPREARRLTLYRDNRRLGSYLIHTKPKPPPPSPPRLSRPIRGSGIVSLGPSFQPTPQTSNHEHLAFTKDGKYLSWAIDDGTGVRLFVFRAPEP